MLVLSAVVFVPTALTVNAQTGKDLVLQRLSQSDLPVIRAQKGFSTLIEFPADQKIVDVTCGDKEFWVVEGGGRYLHIKPAKEGVVTNLNVVMEGDIVYAFLLKEISRAGVSEIADLARDRQARSEARGESSDARRLTLRGLAGKTSEPEATARNSTSSHRFRGKPNARPQAPNVEERRPPETRRQVEDGAAH